jgi:hypothetical protein
MMTAQRIVIQPKDREKRRGRMTPEAYMADFGVKNITFTHTLLRDRKR